MTHSVSRKPHKPFPFFINFSFLLQRHSFYHTLMFRLFLTIINSNQQKIPPTFPSLSPRMAAAHLCKSYTLFYYTFAYNILQVPFCAAKRYYERTVSQFIVTIRGGIPNFATQKTPRFLYHRKYCNIENVMIILSIGKDH